MALTSSHTPGSATESRCGSVGSPVSEASETQWRMRSPAPRLPRRRYDIDGGRQSPFESDEDYDDDDYDNCIGQWIPDQRGACGSSLITDSHMELTESRCDTRGIDEPRSRLLLENVGLRNEDMYVSCTGNDVSAIVRNSLGNQMLKDITWTQNRSHAIKRPSCSSLEAIDTAARKRPARSLGAPFIFNQSGLSF